jgi:hypothetical protein
MMGQHDSDARTRMHGCNGMKFYPRIRAMRVVLMGGGIDGFSRNL